jgi:hypothetical protein
MFSVKIVVVFFVMQRFPFRFLPKRLTAVVTAISVGHSADWAPLSVSVEVHLWRAPALLLELHPLPLRPKRPRRATALGLSASCVLHLLNA